MALQLAALLLSARANLTRSDSIGALPLHIACSHARAAHTATVEVLVAHGADVYARDVQARTPLHCAAHCGAYESAALLCERAGASLACYHPSY